MMKEDRSDLAELKSARKGRKARKEKEKERIGEIIRAKAISIQSEEERRLVDAVGSSDSGGDCAPIVPGREEPKRKSRR